MTHKTAKKCFNKNVIFTKLRKWLLIIAVIIAGYLIIASLLNNFAFKPVNNPKYGVSFTKQRAEEFGLNWKANYTALLDDMGLRHYRLTSYWSEHEAVRGTFDFSSLDWMMDEAAKRGATVSLAIGLRQPRWPECHQPEWAMQLAGNQWKQALYAYMEVVVSRYKNHPALQSYQLENEAVNNWFGECNRPDRQRLNEEFTFVKQWDPDHPVIMSLSDQHGIPMQGPVPDIYGFSVYRIVYNTIGPKFYTYYPTSIWYHRLRAAIITAIHHKPIIIHELQMEPWGPINTSQMSIEEQNKSMSAQQIPKSFKFAKQIGLQDIDLWGGEWWYWRKVHFGDNSIWSAVKSEINN
ncbi:MAG: beta-galactosidase [Candidatus Woesebacteria bacterium]|jgi:hypothetical protein